MPTVCLDCQGWTSPLIFACLINQHYLITGGVIVISLLLYIISFSSSPSPSLLVLHKRISSSFVRPSAVFETKLQLGLSIMFRVHFNRRSCAKMKSHEAPIELWLLSSHRNFPHLLQIVKIILREEDKTRNTFRLRCILLVLSFTDLNLLPGIINLTGLFRGRLYHISYYCFYELPSKGSPSVLLCNHRPRWRRLSPWKRCLT